MRIENFESQLTELTERARDRMDEAGKHATRKQIATSLLIASHQFVAPAPATDDEEPLAALQGVFGEMPIKAGDAFYVRIEEDGEGFTVEPVNGVSPQETEEALRDGAAMFHGYAQLHFAKGTDEGDDKGQRNARMAAKLFAALDEPYEMPIPGPREPQERDSAAEAPETPLGGSIDLETADTVRDMKVADVPMDRQEVMTYLDAKLDGLTKHGMAEAYQVVLAIRGELAQHMEAAPVDTYRALTEIIRGISEYNVGKGWWSDANVDLRTCDYAKYVMASKMFLVDSEMGEAMEGHRKSSKTKTLMDDHLPEFPMVAVEFADALIRLFDLGGNYRLPNGGLIDVPAAVVAKLAYNDRREDHKVEVRAQEGGKSI